MSAPGSRALHPAVAVGTLLARRYRLERPLPPLPGDPDDAQRWLAVDDVLARPVDVLLVAAHGRRAAWARALLHAAAAAGTVPSPVPASVYDAALEEVPAERYGRPGGTVDVAYVVTEHVRGTTLADALSGDAPLEPGDAVGLAAAAAEGLRAMHARGVVHGGVSPATVVLGDDGGLRLRDTAVAGVLARRSDDGWPAAERPEDDVRALGACLYAMLTGRWPERATSSPAAGLRPAPLTAGRDGRLCSPRQVRAGVPRQVDEAVLRVLEPDSRPGTTPVRTAEELLTVLREAADADAAARTPAPRPRRAPALTRAVPPALSRRLPLVLVVVLLVAVAVTGYSRGRELGTVESEQGGLEALVGGTPSPVPGGDGGAGQRIDLTAPGLGVTAFDPPPGDGAESGASVPNAVDGDPGTAWETERYDTARFGGIKPGVGLLVDLGRPTAVEQVELGLSPGADVELRVADERFPDVAAYPVVASATDTEPVVRLVPQTPVTARYVLVWFTELPPVDGGFRARVQELSLVRP